MAETKTAKAAPVKDAGKKADYKGVTPGDTLYKGKPEDLYKGLRTPQYGGAPLPQDLYQQPGQIPMPQDLYGDLMGGMPSMFAGGNITINIYTGGIPYGN